jgi:protein-tyrosine phosphatase
MFRILFVCMGNICRSPTACGVMHAHIERRQLAHLIEVDSAGTYAGHKGEKADRRAITLALSRGYPHVERLRARRVLDQDFERFDLILAMDRDNLARLQQQCPPEHQHKLHLFLAYAGQGSSDEVPDQYYGNAAGFEVVLRLCEQGSEGVLDRVVATMA